MNNFCTIKSKFCTTETYYLSFSEFVGMPIVSSNEIVKCWWSVFVLTTTSLLCLKYMHNCILLNMHRLVLLRCILQHFFFQRGQKWNLLHHVCVCNCSFMVPGVVQHSAELISVFITLIMAYFRTMLFLFVAFVHL